MRQLIGTALASAALLFSVSASAQLGDLLRRARDAVDEAKQSVESSLDDVRELGDDVKELTDEVQGLASDELPGQAAARMAERCRAGGHAGCEASCSQAESLITPELPKENVDWLLGQCRDSYDAVFAAASVDAARPSAPVSVPPAPRTPAPSTPVTGTAAVGPSAAGGAGSAADAPAAAAAIVPADVLDQFRASCQGGGYTRFHYDCECIVGRVPPIWAKRRSEDMAYFEQQMKPRTLLSIESLRQMGREDEARRLELQLADDERAAAMPSIASVELELYTEEAAVCFSKPLIVEYATGQCLMNEGQATTRGTRIDASYCGCYADKYAGRSCRRGRPAAAR